MRSMACRGKKKKKKGTRKCLCFLTLVVLDAMLGNTALFPSPCLVPPFLFWGSARPELSINIFCTLENLTSTMWTLVSMSKVEVNNALFKAEQAEAFKCFRWHKQQAQECHLFVQRKTFVAGETLAWCQIHQTTDIKVHWNYNHMCSPYFSPHSHCTG